MRCVVYVILLMCVCVEGKSLIFPSQYVTVMMSALRVGLTVVTSLDSVCVGRTPLESAVTVVNQKHTD